MTRKRGRLLTSTRSTLIWKQRNSFSPSCLPSEPSQSPLDTVATSLSLTDGTGLKPRQITDLIARNATETFVESLSSASAIRSVTSSSKEWPRQGKGNARCVVAGDRLEPMIVMSMLKDALQPFLSDVCVDWGGAKIVNLFDSSPAAPVVPQPAAVKGSLMEHRTVSSKPELEIRELPTCMLRTPFKVPLIHSSTRFTVFSLLRPDRLASQISVMAQSPDGPLKLVMEVERHSGNMVQKLAARALIRDLEDGTSWFHEPYANQSPTINKQQTKHHFIPRFQSLSKNS